MFSKLLYCINPKAKVGERLHVRAAEPIKEGELLLVDKPYVACHRLKGAKVLPSAIHPDAVLAEGRTSQEALFLELLKKNKLEAYARTCALEDYTWDPLRIVRNGIHETTLPGMEIPYGAALYEKLVYFDHACKANAYVTSGKHQNVYVVAKQDIEKDEEVFINYVDFPKGDCAANYSTDLLGFKCECETCLLYDQQETKKTLEVPAIFKEKAEKTDISMQLVQRGFLQLLEMFSIHSADVTNYRRQYKVISLMMRQKEAWKKFCEVTEGNILVFIGFKVCIAALLHYRDELYPLTLTQLSKNNSFNELYLFWYKWVDILTTRSFGDYVPDSYRYGLMLHSLLAKYFRMVKGKSDMDFRRIYVKLIDFMKKNLCAHKDETWCFELLMLHLDILGWVRIFKTIQHWGQQK